MRYWSKGTGIRGSELGSALAAAALFFLVLCSYYILRPIRDELSTRNPGGLQWLFSGTFIFSIVTVPLFGWASSRFTRKRLLPTVLTFVSANILAFYFLFRAIGFNGTPAYAFFIWLSVYNMAVISILWAFCNDVFRNEPAKRMYGFIAAGASIGAIVGPALTAALVMLIGALNLMLLATLLLVGAVPLTIYLAQWGDRQDRTASAPITGSVWDGIRLALQSPYLLKIALVLVALTFINTVLYVEQAAILKDHVASTAQRTRILAGIDLAVNVLALTMELGAVGPLLTRIRSSRLLSGVLAMTGVGLAILSAAPGIATLVVMQVFRRSTDYAIIRPVREILFTVVSREENYKAKNFLDVVVFRGGDAVSGWAIAGLRTLFAAPQVAMLAVPIALGGAWAASMLEPQPRRRAIQEVSDVA